eukprot:3823602-Pleurochrysis_carterae.AAC.2
MTLQRARAEANVFRVGWCSLALDVCFAPGSTGPLSCHHWDDWSCLCPARGGLSAAPDVFDRGHMQCAGVPVTRDDCCPFVTRGLAWIPATRVNRRPCDSDNLTLS